MTIQQKWMAVHYEKGNRCVNPCNIYFKLEKILSKYVSLIGAVMVVVMIKTQFLYNQISLSIWTAWKVGLPQQNKDKVIQFKYQEIDHSCLIEPFSYLTYMHWYKVFPPALMLVYYEYCDDTNDIRVSSSKIKVIRLLILSNISWSFWPILRSVRGLI